MLGGFSHNGKTLLSGVNPAGRADKTADAVPVADGTLYFCPSPLFGYGLERLLSRLVDFPHSALLCIETDPVLYTLSQEHFPPSLTDNPQLRLTNLCESRALCTFIKQEWGARFFRRIQTVRLSGGWQLFPALYNSLTESLQQEIALDWGNAMTLAKLGRLYIRNALRNLPLIPRCPSVHELSFGSRPVLVLGAGLSLDHALDAMPACFGDTHRLPHTRSFSIVCVDSSLTALKDRGIQPDLVVILESQHWNLIGFTGLSGWGINAALDLSALPRSAAVLGGNVFLFFTPWAKLNIFSRMEAAGLLPMTLPPLGSVGLSAVSIALGLSRGVIITAGLDFSFSLDTSHARSTGGHRSKLIRHNRLSNFLNTEAAFNEAVFNTTSKSGIPVLSNPAMRNYRDLFEREFAAGKDAPSRIFDLSGSGLPLGITTLSLQEAFRLLEDRGNAFTGRREASNVRDRECREKTVRSEKQLDDFITSERARLLMLKDLLTGTVPMDHMELETLIDECDYLWGHFPDYAASDRRPGIDDLSFLKRLRVEIDPFLRLLDKL